MRKRRLLIERIALLFISISGLVVLIFSAGLVDPAVQFADPGLEAVVREKLEKPEKPIHKSDLLTITALDASGRDISDLQGIKHLRQLVNLNLEDNFVEDLAPIASLYKLTELNLSNNKIASLVAVNFEAITGLPLQKLSLRHNVVRLVSGEQIWLTDIRLLQKLTQLEELDLRDNHIGDITPLRSLTNLKVLDLRENLITDISPLKNLTELEELNLRENDLSSIASLGNLEDIVYLNIHSNYKIESIEPLLNLVKLETLIMRHVYIGERVHDLNKLTNLKRLNIRDCEIIKPPKFSSTGGFYEEEFKLELTHEQQGTLIYYTLDGSEPDPVYNAEQTIRYSQPILIRNRKNEPNTISLIEPGYGEFEGREEWKGPDGKVFKATVVKAKAIKNDVFSSFVETHTFFVDEDMKARYSLPVISISTDSENFFDSELGIYVRGEIFEDTVGFWRELNPEALTHYQPANFHQRGRLIIDAGGLVVEEHENAMVALPLLNHGFDLNFNYLREVPQIIINGTKHYDGTHYIEDASTENKLVLEVPYVSETLPAGARVLSNWERPVRLEFYEDNGSLAFSQNLGMRIHGGASRTGWQKHLRVYARGYYAKENTIDYRFFPEDDTYSFKRFILRGMTERSGLDDAIGQLFMRKVYPKMDIQRYRPVIVFLNGEFWGLYSLRDRYDEWYLSLKYGIETEEIVILEGNGTIEWGRSGDDLHFKNMDQLIRKGCMSNNGNYEYIHNLMDVDNYMAYMLTGIYLNYTDWGVGKHQKVWRYKTEHGSCESNTPYGLDGRWRWMPLDLDGVFIRGGEADRDYLSEIADSEVYLFHYLLENEIFKIDFINKFADMLNTVFRKEAAIHSIDEIVTALPENAIDEHIKRWRHFDSTEDWYNHIEFIYDFLRDRPENMRRHIVEYFELSGTASVHLIINLSKGTIIVNSIDIRQFLTSEVNKGEWSGIYFKGIPITITAIPNPDYIFSGWEEIEETDESLEIILTEDIILTPVFIKR